MCMVCSDPKQCPQVCPDCKGSKVYQPLIGPAVPCTLCKGEGCLCPMPGPSGHVSQTPPADETIIVDQGWQCNFDAHLINIIVNWQRDPRNTGRNYGDQRGRNPSEVRGFE